MENKKILRIVITGGPCGGKTSALGEITKTFREQGFTVMSVNEAATELIDDGVKPFGNDNDKLELIDFQRVVLEEQLAKEKTRDFAAKACKNDKVIILYDRGILDNRAYLKDEEFKMLIDEKNITEAEILSRYDLVIHLVTAADGKEEYYERTRVRTETIEEARQKDRRTMESWSNHPNLKIIGNDTLFDEKIKKAVNSIREFLGENEVIEQEKYKIEIPGIDYSILANFLSVHLLKEEIQQFVKKYSNNEDELYRKSTIDGSSYYTCTKMKYNDNGPRTTMIKNITEEEYLDNLAEEQGKEITKTRYNFIYNGERYRMDFYHDPANLVTLERDITSKHKKSLPPFINKDNITVITNDRDFSDANICNVINEVREKVEVRKLHKKLNIKESKQ